MVSVIATNIISPLGITTEENYRAVLAGRSALKRYLPGEAFGLPEPFAASLFSEEQRKELALEGYTFFEALAIRSIRTALTYTSLGNEFSRIVLILSTTKGNIEESPAKAAQRIAEAIGLTTKPIVVCNACVSGLSAQLLANHLLSAGHYDYAIVVGAEVQSKFIVSGFQSLKAVSEEPCRPFDIERNGLNPGEAAATIVFARNANKERWSYSQMIGKKEHWCLISGATCNDAYHLISPSPQGEGLTNAIMSTMKGHDKQMLATVCAHGTATLYNDQMESVAIQRAGLSDIPLSALKGYVGHTMGAAGVLETILTMLATDDGIVLPTKGFTEPGVSGRVNISGDPQSTSKKAFLKIMSGFGGCNVAALYVRTTDKKQETTSHVALAKANTIRISSEDGTSLTDIYKQEIGNYPKLTSSSSRFYKMDILSRLAFVAAEKTLSNSPFKGEDKMPALVLFNHSSSIVADRQFLTTISNPENYFPSPSAFVYTLPNITTGEIAIRHHLCSETSFYILADKDENLMTQILEATLSQTGATSAITGWIDAESETNFECEMRIISTNS